MVNEVLVEYAQPSEATDKGHNRVGGLRDVFFVGEVGNSQHRQGR